MDVVTTAHVSSLEEAKEYIYSIDFSNIIYKMVNHLGWLKHDALTVCNMYRNFLFLQMKYGKDHKLPPTEEIDEFWHLHILDSKNYRKDCDAIFGEYFDHYPYFGIDGKNSIKDVEDAFETMQKLYAKEFNGERIYQIRSFYSKVASFVKMKVMKQSKGREATLV